MDEIGLGFRTLPGLSNAPTKEIKGVAPSILVCLPYLNGLAYSRGI